MKLPCWSPRTATAGSRASRRAAARSRRSCPAAPGRGSRPRNRRRPDLSVARPKTASSPVALPPRGQQADRGRSPATGCSAVHLRYRSSPRSSPPVRRRRRSRRRAGDREPEQQQDQRSGAEAGDSSASDPPENERPGPEAPAADSSSSRGTRAPRAPCRARLAGQAGKRGHRDTSPAGSRRARWRGGDPRGRRGGGERRRRGRSDRPGQAAVGAARPTFPVGVGAGELRGARRGARGTDLRTPSTTSHRGEARG